MSDMKKNPDLSERTLKRTEAKKQLVQTPIPTDQEESKLVRRKAQILPIMTPTTGTDQDESSEETILTEQQVKDGNSWLERSGLTDKRIVFQIGKRPPRPKTPSPRKLPVRPVGKSKNLPIPKFTDSFTPQALKSIGKGTDRGLLKGGRGKFERPYKKAQEIVDSYAQYLSGNEEPPEKIRAKMKEDLQKLQERAQYWLDKRLDNDSDDEQDDTFNSKVTACQDMVKMARTALLQLRFKEVEMALKDQNNPSPELLDEYRALDAELLMTVGETSRPSTGTSEVSLLKTPGGKVAYAFKSIKGESEQMGIPKGAGAVRETLMGQLCSLVDEKWDLGFQWPGASMAKLSGENGEQLGVLIDGLPGIPGEKVDSTVLHKIPPSEIQKVALCDLAFGQFDVKWDNVFVDETEDGVKVCPYDGGAALPNKHMLVTQLFGGQMDDLGKPLLVDLQGKELDSVSEPIDDTLRDHFLQIDTDELERVAREGMKRLQTLNLDPEELGVVEGTGFAIESIRAIQNILTKNPKISLKDFITEYRENFLKPLAEKLVPGWEDDIRKKYRVLWQQHKELLPEPVNPEQEVKYKNDPSALFNKFLDPAQRERLALLEKVGGRETLQKYGVRVPIPSAGDGVSLLKGKIPKGEKANFPDLWPKQ